MRMPLEDVTVLDLSHALAGPFCSTEMAHPRAGTVRMVGAPVRLSETPGAVRTPAPLLGEHTDEVLRERLGLDAGRIAALRAAGAIGPA